MTAAIIKLTIGSIQGSPVITIAIPAITTPAETAASAVMCTNALRMLRSPLRPDRNISAVAVLMAMPTSETQITVLPATSIGTPKRRIASHTIAPTETRRRMALKRAARIEELRRPYVLRFVGAVLANALATHAS